MKKILLILFLSPTIIFAQQFTLTPHGLRDISDTSKNYLVITESSKTAKQLYDRCIAYINEKYHNPDKIIKAKTDSEYIRIERYTSNFTSQHFSFWGDQPVSCLSTIEFKFKDGKIRYEVIAQELKTSSGLTVAISESGNFKTGKTVAFIYDKNLSLNKERAAEKNAIENLYNNEIVAIVNSISPKNDW